MFLYTIMKEKGHPGDYREMDVVLLVYAPLVSKMGCIKGCDSGQGTDAEQESQ